MGRRATFLELDMVESEENLGAVLLVGSVWMFCFFAPFSLELVSQKEEKKPSCCGQCWDY